MKSLTGTTAENEKTSAYQVMLDNGYTGTLTQWLNSLVKNSEKLGHPKEGKKTDYEYACEYGFNGTYIEWMVSLVSTESK